MLTCSGDEEKSDGGEGKSLVVNGMERGVLMCLCKEGERGVLACLQAEGGREWSGHRQEKWLWQK